MGWQMGRVGLLGLLACLVVVFSQAGRASAVGPAALDSCASQGFADDECWTVIGYSQGGLPLTIYHLGQGPSRVLILGGQHGGPEGNTVELAASLLSHFGANPEEVPAEASLDIMVVANPDGLATGSRQFLSGVDPNRNWGGADWQPDAWDSNGVFRPGLGGPAPFSEPETRALHDWVLATRPVLVINYHSAGGFMFGAQNELVDAYAEGSGYYRPQPGGPRLLNYRVSGSMNVWMREHGLVGMLVELTSPYSPEFARNLAGVRAVLSVLGSYAG
jgi:Zinc carboxypeptidase